jgi:hypothetical protein
MLKFYKILRATVVTLLIVLVGLPSLLYIVLSTPWAQNYLRSVGEEELTKLLGSEVLIGRVMISPFNKIDLGDVSVNDDYGKTALSVKEINARFELSYFIKSGEIVIDYARICDMSARLYKLTPDDPLNIANIIEKLKSKDENKEPTKFRLAIDRVEIINASASFDIVSAPHKTQGLDTKHLSVTELNLLATLPVVSNDDVTVVLDRFSLKEHSGLSVKNIETTVRYTPHSIDVTGLSLSLDRSKVKIGDIALNFDSPDELKNLAKTVPVSAEILPDSYVTLSDLGFAVPALANVDRSFTVALNAAGTKDQINLNTLKIDELGGHDAHLSLSGAVTSPTNRDSLTVKDLKLAASLNGGNLQDLVSKLTPRPSDLVLNALPKMGRINLNANVDGSISDFAGDVDLKTAIGSVTFNGSGSVKDLKNMDASFDGVLNVSRLNVGQLLARQDFGAISAEMDATCRVKGKQITADGSFDVKSVVFKGHEYNNIAIAGDFDKEDFNGTISVNDDLAHLALQVSGSLNKTAPNLNFDLDIWDTDLNAMGLTNKYVGYKLNLKASADLSGKLGEWVNGYANVRDVRFGSGNEDDPTLIFNNLLIEANNTVRPNYVNITSDVLNGSIIGGINLKTIGPDVKRIIAQVIPAFLSSPAPDNTPGQRQNIFDFDLKVDNTENLMAFLKSSVRPIVPVTIDGRFDSTQSHMTINVDAPYLLQGTKIIENTALQADIDANDQRGNIYITTQMPTKKGDLAVVANITASDNRVDTQINWLIDREKSINGEMSLSALLGRDEQNRFMTTVNLNPGTINFGSTVWKINPATINYAAKNINVDGFALSADNQHISINGEASDDEDSEMIVDLKNIQLENIFETLDINKALIGGSATGTFHAKKVFSTEPEIYCDNLFVKNIGYNYCTLGDGDVKAHWDNEKKSVYLDADITEPGGEHSRIYGDIIPAEEALDITFDAKHVRVGFMKPFMAAFADDVNGYASGHARLFGTFKYIDLEGDLYAENLGLKVGFTNTWYYATDSVHLRPGLIDLKDITIKDQYGHKGLLNGFVKHTFFKEPVFNFAITKTENLLCYDVTPNLNDAWYGRIFGNGSAYISGEPGVVNIDVNMTTAPGSTFTFVLSDQEIADDYAFITFRNKHRDVISDSIIETDLTPAIVREIQEKMKQKNTDVPSAYNMNFQVDITPQAKIILVMDPVGGDEIKAYGSGNLRMTYTMPGDDLRMYGSYTIDRGSYNFTLQDIIVKDFTINEGSNISFTGDPYSARLDIKAIYNVNANLSDLDESFLQDKELNRTNVPVHALLLVNGDMRQPDISFDLEFPTLTQDTYRKVKSIISTDEMMNRQIVYLLALNRFYTPDYMSTTKGNELFSVASSTISSQLSSMLGKISENWSIAPNFRSDRGDFSDLEVDLALSSSLLNNRLRFNGNFGYRDKSLNTNQFIGDFDLEYLLNRSGSWRLKAYNRYNDQNYYLRSATTTQGVGIMFRRDFDKLFNFLKRKKKDGDDTTKSPVSAVNKEAVTDESTTLSPDSVSSRD